MKYRTCYFVVLASLLPATTATAATTLTSDGFESGLGNWTVTGTSSGLYTYGGTGSNFASDGNGAVKLNRQSGTLTLTNALPLATQLYTSLTLDFKVEWEAGSGTRRLRAYYASDGSTYAEFANFTWGASGSANATTGVFSFQFTEGTAGNAGVSVLSSNAASITKVAGFDGLFTDNAKFRFTYSDGGTSTANNVYVDSILITGSPDFVPEPSAALLGGIGALLLLRRRRP